jgi:integrase
VVKVRFKGVFSTSKRLADGTRRTYFYYRPTGERLPDDPTSRAFAAAYERAKKKGPRSLEGTIAHLVEDYRATSPRFAKLAKSTKSEYTRHLDAIKETAGDLDIEEITQPDIIAAQDALAATPRTADMRVNMYRVIFKHAVRRGWRTDNPAAGIEAIADSESYRPWSEELIRRFVEKAPAHVVTPFILALYTGQRQSDVLRMTWGDIIDGTHIQVRQDKTGEYMVVAIHSDLKAHLDAMTKGPGRIALNSRKGPWTTDGFKSSFADAKRDLEIEGFVFHGLRHTAASRLFEAGNDVDDIMAVTGHRTRKMVERYIKEADRKKRSTAAIGRLPSRTK